MSLTPTVDKTLTIKDHRGHKICDVTYPSNSFTDSETKEIWEGRMYPPLRLKEEPKVIVDIGACWGDSTLFFATLYKDAKVYAFEPTPDSFAYLTKNTEPFRDRITLHQTALACNGVGTKMMMHVGNNTTGGVCNSLRPEGPIDKNDPCIEVPVMGAASAMRLHGISKIDILKVDVEGAEGTIFEDLKEYLPHIQVIYVEYHHEHLRRIIDRLLETHNLVCCRVCGNCVQGELTYARMDAVTFAEIPTN